MSLSFSEVQAINEISNFLYNFLPVNPHPYANQSISFKGIAYDLGLSSYWLPGSKLPAITNLLEKTLENRRDLFCKLMLEIVNRSLKYKNNKGQPIKREDIERLNQLIRKVDFKIPELWNRSFLNSLPTDKKETIKQNNKPDLNNLKDYFLQIKNMEPQERGYAFEKFLKELFSVFNLEPRGSFKLTGEQIDGSFQLDSDTYLLEAKWCQKPVGFEQLSAFKVKVEGKAAWSRGLFISYNDFSREGKEAFIRSGATSIICMTGQDLFFILDGLVSLQDAIRYMARRAAETGDILVSLYEICTLS